MPNFEKDLSLKFVKFGFSKGVPMDDDEGCIFFADSVVGDDVGEEADGVERNGVGEVDDGVSRMG